MSTPIYDNTTKSYITMKTAAKRGFPGDNFIVRPGYKVFALKDGRTNRGYRWEATSSAFQVKYLSGLKTARSLESMRKVAHTYPINYDGGVWTQPYDVISQLNVVPERTPFDIQILDSAGNVIKSTHIRNNVETTASKLYKSIFLFTFNDTHGLRPEWAAAV